MAEYIEREAAIKAVVEAVDNGLATTSDDLQEILAELPASDVAPVVRCADCKHMYFKDFNGFCKERVHPCSPAGYCERGVLRKKPEGAGP